MNIYAKATNTGADFITHDDRMTFTIRNIGLDIYEMSGDYQTWVTRVGATVIPEAQALRELAVENAKTVSMRQARRALINNNLLGVVDIAVAQLPLADRSDWEYATDLDIDNPTVQQIKTLLSWTDEQLEDLFIEAAAID